MTSRRSGGQAWMMGTLLVLAAPLLASAAQAQPQKVSTHNLAAKSPTGTSHGGMKAKTQVLARRGYYGLQCVTFARAETGITLDGNAADWWRNAAGVYQRGSAPELGSVLNFRANGRMHLGHVAVVTNVVDSRQIDIDQANWPTPGVHGAVARDIRVIDVSPNNDWTAVRVALGHSDTFGSVYPTYGFIYDRADHGVVVTASAEPAVLLNSAPVPALNPPPADLRPASQRGFAVRNVGYEEVAEAPSGPQRHRTAKHRALQAHAKPRPHGTTRF